MMEAKKSALTGKLKGRYGRAWRIFAFKISNKLTQAGFSRYRQEAWLEAYVIDIEWCKMVQVAASQVRQLIAKKLILC